MADYLSDEELNELIRRINSGSAESRGSDDASLLAAPVVDEEDPLRGLLLEMVEKNATDLHLIEDEPPVLRVDGRLQKATSPPVDGRSMAALFEAHVRQLRGRLAAEGSVDFSLRMRRGEGDERDPRFRVNVHRQRGQIAAAIRALPVRIPTLEELSLPPAMHDLAAINRGLVLLCGPTGSGKTTTLASLIDEVNRSRPVHIITIEDPIEYEHRNDSALVEQIEIGRDSPSFAAALRSALRQDPDIILVGEMRDLETIAIALTAAETGHLIFSTLHTGDAEQAIHRIIDVFPAQQQQQIRHQLAISLRALVVQQLLPRAGGRGRIPAIEILLANQPVRAHIRNDRIQNIANELTLGRRQGMLPLEESLAELVRRELITREEAELRSRRPDDLASRMMNDER
jgi:twitching motility protein PilT